MKNTKRILEVKIVRATDTDPDTSYYGEYSNKPDSEFTLDRATDEFQGDIDNGRDWLERVESRLQDEYDERDYSDTHDFGSGELPKACIRCGVTESEGIENNCANAVVWDLQNAIDTVYDLRNDAPFDDDSVSWNSREYRYFNPSDNYKGEPAEDIRKYVRQDFERMESYNRGHWYYVGMYATAEVELSAQVNKGCVPGHEVYTKSIQTIRSGGLWGTESDSDRSHFEEIEKEELSSLRNSLKILGFSTRAISVAFKNVVRGEE